MMKKTKFQKPGLLWAVAFALVLMVLGGSFSPSLAAEHHAISLQLFHPMATSPDPDTSTNTRLALLFGRSGDINGLDLTGVASSTRGNFSGFQVTGLYSRVVGEFSGWSLNAGVQSHYGPATGVQITGLANYHQSTFTGAQIAGALNYAHVGFNGAQISSLMNLNDGHGSFLQTSSVANVNAKTFSGLQLAGIMNFTGEQADGAQVSLVNYATSMHGLQMGGLNLSDHFSGLQVGVVNITKTHEGTPFGVVNLADDGKINGLVYGSNLSLFNVGLRTVVNGWSSILSLGYNDASGGDDVAVNSGFIGWNFGRQVPLSESMILTLDAGYSHIIPKDYDDAAINDAPHYALQLRAFVDYPVAENVALMGGGGLSTLFSEYTTHARSRSEAHVFAGISLF